MTIPHIVRTANLNHLTHPIYYEVKNVTVREYVDLGKASDSPEKIGRQPRINDALLEAIDIHVTGIQASGEIGKADNSIMMTTIDAMVQGTGFEGYFTTEWCWRIVWNYYPETLVPTDMFDHEGCCEDWLKFKNINHWIDGAKHILLDLRFIKDKRCTFPGR